MRASKIVFFSGRPTFLIVAGFLCLSGCTSQKSADTLEGTLISEVTIHGRGAKSVDEKRLRSFIRTIPGSTYESEQIDGDIRSLYESGLVNDVRVSSRPEGTRVKVIFEVEERPRMGPSGFVGNTAFSDQRLARQTGFRPGQKIDQSALLSAARKLERYYHANGYREAKVSVRSGSDAETNPDVIFIVEEGAGPDR